ncbi:hypothetical protein D9619_007619 [Psilocybe cf. subviscida]|uniref:FHA domain-containing protein n=1 Tax=Psilocybe cf. subviscida TaxID=2480587 RepID=A0A8H5EXA1_9AGAR|nr:hypothetical protein D9619_007619 [Psilocybe cf. subviscida]
MQKPSQNTSQLSNLRLPSTAAREHNHQPQARPFARMDRSRVVLHNYCAPASTPARDPSRSPNATGHDPTTFVQAQRFIFIKDVKSSNDTFINGERLSSEGHESEPFELKSDDIVELGIDIVGEDNKTIIRHKAAARVVCVFIEQDVAVAARANQHVMALHLQQLMYRWADTEEDKQEAWAGYRGRVA